MFKPWTELKQEHWPRFEREHNHRFDGNSDSGFGGNISHKGTVCFSDLRAVGDRAAACF